MRRALATAAALGLALTVSSPAQAATPPPWCDEAVWSGGGWLCVGGTDEPATPGHRVAGADRYQTSVALSQAFGDGHDGPAVYLVAHDGIDALALGGYDLHGPILYVPRGGAQVPAPVTAEIARLSPAVVYAIGGTNAVTDVQLDAARTAAGQ